GGDLHIMRSPGFEAGGFLHFPAPAAGGPLRVVASVKDLKEAFGIPAASLRRPPIPGADERGTGEAFAAADFYSLPTQRQLAGQERHGHHAALMAETDVQIVY